MCSSDPKYLLRPTSIKKSTTVTSIIIYNTTPTWRQAWSIKFGLSKTCRVSITDSTNTDSTEVQLEENVISDHIMWTGLAVLNLYQILLVVANERFRMLILWIRQSTGVVTHNFFYLPFRIRFCKVLLNLISTMSHKTMCWISSAIVLYVYIENFCILCDFFTLSIKTLHAKHKKYPVHIGVTMCVMLLFLNYEGWYVMIQT
jgi:hypothetical protein